MQATGCWRSGAPPARRPCPSLVAAFALPASSSVWLDPALRYRRAWDLLVPGGHLAFWRATHVFSEGGDPFFAELQEVYEEIGEDRPEGAVYPRTCDLPVEREEIERCLLYASPSP